MSEPSIDELRDGVELACQAAYVPRLMEGRSKVLTMPREWTLEHIEAVAKSALNLSDCWEYRRLLELAELLGDPALVKRLILLGLGHPDFEVDEAARDHQEKYPT